MLLRPSRCAQVLRTGVDRIHWRLFYWCGVQRCGADDGMLLAGAHRHQRRQAYVRIASPSDGSLAVYYSRHSYLSGSYHNAFSLKGVPLPKAGASSTTSICLCHGCLSIVEADEYIYCICTAVTYQMCLPATLMTSSNCRRELPGQVPARRLHDRAGSRLQPPRRVRLCCCGGLYTNLSAPAPTSAAGFGKNFA